MKLPSDECHKTSLMIVIIKFAIIFSLETQPGNCVAISCCLGLINLLHKSHSAPCPTMHQSEQKCAHFFSEWCIVRYGTGGLWYLWNGSFVELFSPSLTTGVRKSIQNIPIIMYALLCFVAALYHPILLISFWATSPALAVIIKQF